MVCNIREYRTVHLPAGLIEEVLKVITEHKDLGYRNKAEFVIEATRRRLEEIKKQKNTSK